jgi:hypothetical protein
MLAMPVSAAMVEMALMELQAHPMVVLAVTEAILAALVLVVADPRLALMAWSPAAAVMGVTAVPSVMPGMVALAGMAPPGLMVTLGRQRVIQVRTARSVAAVAMVAMVVVPATPVLAARGDQAAGLPAALALPPLRAAMAVTAV